jgi:protein-ribulosamine 3-kinase
MPWKFPQALDWDENGASFFAKMFRAALKLDAETNGRWKELDDIGEKTLNKVIPRLLEALQAEGRTIKPCLIHGDFWEGNTGLSNGRTYIFDAGVYYAHNEMELGIW